MVVLNTNTLSETLANYKYIELTKEAELKGANSMMKSTKILVILMCIYMLVACSTSNNDTFELSKEDKELIASTTTEYYQNLMKERYQDAFNSLAFTEDNSIDIDTRNIVLQELKENINYRIQWVKSVSVSDISFNGNENMPFLSTIVSVNYDNVNRADINEVLYFVFVESEGHWKIKKIESLDRYIPYRSPDYRISVTPDFLIPKNK